MILRARVVVTMDGPPIENGAVAISTGRVVGVGKFNEINARYPGDIVDLGERVLLPGLINAHCHLDYTCLRGKIGPQKSFTDWIRAINAEKAKLSADDYIASINEGFAEAKKFGTTTIANLTAFPELISRIPQPPIRTFWFPELIDVRNPGELTANLTALSGQVSTAATESDGGGWGLAPHAPFTASADLYRRCAEVASLLTTHLAESREEMEMFQNARGALYEFLKGIGRDMSDCGMRTPLEIFVTIRDVSVRAGLAYSLDMTKGWILVHLNELTESDLDLLGQLPKSFSIAHCPRSHAYFGHSPFQFERLAELGFNICLGTDSLASNDDLSLFAEMRAFQKNRPNVYPEDILSMVTVNPARALGQADQLGRIKCGLSADLTAIPFPGAPKSIFDEIVAFEGEPWTTTRGEPGGV